jgi:hypothetical protein
VTFVRYTLKNAVSLINARTVDLPDGGQVQLVPALVDSVTKPGHPDFRLVLDTVEQTRVLAEQRGSQFLVVLMPTKEEIYLPLLDESPPLAVAPFVVAFEEAGVPYLDLTPLLQAGARQGEQLFYEVDGHPNATGYELIARAVLDHLRNNAQTYSSERVR